MAERTPTPYLPIMFVAGEEVEDCLRSAYSLSRRLNLGITFTQADREWVIQPWLSWDEVKQQMADVRHEGMAGD